MDAASFTATASDLLIVKCLDPNTSKGAKVQRGVLVEVDIVSVLKGNLKTGKTTLITMPHPMEAGKNYMVAVFHTIPQQPAYQERSEQAFTEIPGTFDLKSLEGKTPAEQAQMIFDARRKRVDAMILKLQKEKKVLEATLPKTN
ncbi:hypothetical protein FRUB_08006 [Fimbriiglobus ruber]|uniref:Uncharacterized protein n=2 Tax=Fimbriiglobus ruber TaxID=1908690 RepID=A0A225D398_9BACT|nr:hypothetical protein FRUB_08006 [Fimbriiglobus ruber]